MFGRAAGTDRGEPALGIPPGQREPGEGSAAQSEPEHGLMRGLAAFRHRNYRLYFGGQFISLIGTWMQNIAQGWLVLQLSHSAFALGIVAALQSLPVLFFALLGGVIADRLPKYRLLVFTQASMAILALVLALDVTAGTVQIWHIYILASLLGVAQSVDMPTRQAFTVEMVGKEDLLNAIALNSALFNSARIVGPSVAGLLIAFVGLALCFYLNAASFLAVIIGLLLMHPSEFRIRGAVQHGGSVVGQLKEGLSYVRRTPFVAMIMIMIGCFSVSAFNFNVILPVFADSVLHKGAAGYGVMSSAMGVGSLLAASVIAFSKQARWTVLIGAIAAFVIFAFGFSLSKSYPLSLVFLAALGASMMTFSTQANTSVQQNTPDILRGRVMSLYMMLFVGSQPLGAFVTGTLAAVFSAPLALITGACVCMLVLAGAFLHGPGRRPSLAEMAAFEAAAD